LIQVKAIWRWLLTARHTWLCLGVIAIAFFASLRPGTTEPVIRITGLVLQLLGIGTVIWGISETRALFGHPTVLQKIKVWVQSFPIRRNVVISASGIASLASASVRARAYVTQGAGENPTTESRLEALEKNISLIYERISQSQAETDREVTELLTRIKSEEQLRQSEDSAIQAKLETTGSGGVHISAIGAAWLFVGVILSTAGVEIAEFIG